MTSHVGYLDLNDLSRESVLALHMPVQMRVSLLGQSQLEIFHGWQSAFEDINGPRDPYCRTDIRSHTVLLAFLFSHD
jgi:hypothetical protein